MSDTQTYANAVVSTKSFAMRDVDKYAEELESMENTQDEGSQEDTQSEGNTNTPTSSEDGNWQKRYSDLQSYMDKEMNTLKSKYDAEKRAREEAEQLAKEAKAQPVQYPVSDEEIKAWAEQFPDFHKTLITIVKKENDAKSQEILKEFKKLEDASKAIAAEKGRNELLKLHPDAFEIEKNPQFKEWLGAAKPGVRRLIESSDPYEIAEGLSLYKARFKPQAKTDNKEASRAVSTNSKPALPEGKKVWKESEVEKMHWKAYSKNEKDIDLARKEGRFIYDLSN